MSLTKLTQIRSVFIFTASALVAFVNFNSFFSEEAPSRFTPVWSYIETALSLLATIGFTVYYCFHFAHWAKQYKTRHTHSWRDISEPAAHQALVAVLAYSVGVYIVFILHLMTEVFVSQYNNMGYVRRNNSFAVLILTVVLVSFQYSILQEEIQKIARDAHKKSLPNPAYVPLNEPEEGKTSRVI